MMTTLRSLLGEVWSLFILDDLKGQLGINSQTGKYYSLPKLVCFHTVIKSVSCGEDHAALITSKARFT